MQFESHFLSGEPCFVIGAVFLFLIVVVLALTRSRLRVLVGTLGFIAGYGLLGTPLAYRFLEDARRVHGCPDAAWGGPPIGGVIGTVVAVTLLTLWQLSRGFMNRRDDSTPPHAPE